MQQVGRAEAIAVMALSAMTIMANATISSSLPGLRAHFADVPGIETLSGLIVTLPSLAIVLTAGLTGWLADRWDRQKMLLIGAGFYLLGGTAGLWAETLEMLLAGRLMLGLGVAVTMTLAMTWAGDLWQGEARARFLGRQGAAISGGGIVFILAGGALASLHWRGAFAVYVLILPVALLALRALAPHARARAATLAARAQASRAPLPERFPWAAYAFIAPLAFVFQVAFYMAPTQLPFRLAELGVTLPLAVGAIMATLTMVSAPVALAYGRLRRYLSDHAVFAIHFALIGCGMALHGLSQSWHGAVLGSVVTGLGIGLAMPNYTSWFMARVPVAARGRAAGLLTTALYLGQFCSPLVTGPLVAHLGLSGGFMAMGLALIGLGAVLALARMLRSEDRLESAELGRG